ncbi:MAG: hypothetical protein AAFN93_07750 [Bacteroidota bacterium]
MKLASIRIFYIVTLVTITNLTFAQTRAVTEKGDTIYVYDNGTWSFDLLDEMPSELDDLEFLSEKLDFDTLTNKFVTPKQANKQVKHSGGMFEINYDEGFWKRVPPATLNDEASFAFEAKDTDIWSVVIAEDTPIQTDKLFLIAKNTMKEYSGADPKVLKTEVRNVNGTDVIRGVMLAEYSGITFIFDSYYFSNDLGSVQFTTWTSQKVWERNESSITDFLNGFVIK